jgi:hypothetical protein
VKIMTTTETMPPAMPAGAAPGGEHAPGPVRRQEYLHRVGMHATLLIVEWFPAADGSLRKKMRFVTWPGL